MSLPEPRTVGRLRIDGEPQTWQRAIPVARGRMITPAATRAAEEAIGRHYREQNPGIPESAHGLNVWLWFYSGYSPANRPDKMPDVDNLTKLILDGLNGVAWTDDKQVTEIHGHLSRGSGEPATVVLIVTEAPQQTQLEITEMDADTYRRVARGRTKRR